MKNLFLSTVFIIILGVMSCKKDESLPKTNIVTSSLETPLNAGENKTKLVVPVVTTVVTGTTVVVSWGPVTNAVSYHVVFEAGSGGIPSIPDLNATSVTVPNLATGAYTVKVSANAEHSSGSLFQDSGFGTAVSFTVGSAVVKAKLATPVVHAAITSYKSGKVMLL